MVAVRHSIAHGARCGKVYFGVASYEGGIDPFDISACFADDFDISDDGVLDHLVTEERRAIESFDISKNPLYGVADVFEIIGDP